MKEAKEGIILKNGGKTLDVKLDRCVQFDERSRNFKVTELILEKTPRSYTWRCNQTLDQGNEGACVGFGVTHELIARPSEVLGLNNTTARNLYHKAQEIDPWPGGSYPGASPFYEGTSVLAGTKIAHKMGYFDEYRWAFGINDLILGVGYNGPAVLGIDWFEGMYYPNAEGFIAPSYRLSGGHCILCRAINVKEKYFTLRNSWGPNWGINGDCFITFDDMEFLLDQQGEAVFFVKRHTVPAV